MSENEPGMEPGAGMGSQIGGETPVASAPTQPKAFQEPHVASHGVPQAPGNESGSSSSDSRLRVWIILGVIAVAIIVGLIVIFTAMGNGGKNDGTSAPNPANTPNQATFLSASPGPGFIKSAVVDQNALTDEKCVSQGNGVSVSGKITNSQKDVQDFRVYVFVSDDKPTAPPTPKLEALQLMPVSAVKAGASQTFSGTIPVQANQPSCTYRVERNAPGAK